jgi:hypothetical protein
MYSQKASIDFTKTYSLVMKSDFIQVVIVIAGTHKMYIYPTLWHSYCFFQWTFSTKNLRDTTWRLCATWGRDICLQIQKLYDIKQIATLWNIKFDTVLKKYNLMSSEVDPCVYQNQGAMETICAIFMDDGILCVVNKQ